MGGKYRANKIKQEHTIIDDIYPLLLKISNLEQVHSIIPGRINRRSGSGIQPYLQLKYNTPSGIKLIAKTSSSLQEIFVVTDNPEETMKLLQQMDFVK
ncbi:metal-binding protein [Anoxybacter fermentans]|uniref:Metal-binding protein n=1 Tax=Anoxybacter fermentans TaxID=1323375 RepID=A0A3Q9HP34_9FIRM|nr:DUF2103 domain-containing protein [Anoxybacter fermentans]AZR72457.1 metal-binding protein [Anoxybacter fermentans]